MSNELPLSVYKKLLEVKKQVTYIKKDKKGFNYEYATPSAVFGSLNPVLNELGLILITNLIEVKSYEINTGVLKEKEYNGVKSISDTRKTEWKYDLNFIFDWVCTETGQKVSIPFSASGVNGEDKGLGSALTYAERYFVLKQFNIPTDTDDPDAFQNKHMSEEEKKAEKEASEKLEKEVAAKAKAEQEKKDAEFKNEYDKAVKDLKAVKDFATLKSTYTGLSTELKAATAKLVTDLKTKFTPETANKDA